MSKAVIVGSGHVGSCLALLLALESVFDEVVLTDKRAARARAEAADMMAALPRLGVRSLVRGGVVSDCADAQVAVITAAAPVKLGQTRNDMFVKNSAVVTDVVREIEATGFSGLYLMVTNPVDVLTYFLVDRLGIDRIPRGGYRDAARHDATRGRAACRLWRGQAGARTRARKSMARASRSIGPVRSSRASPFPQTTAKACAARRSRPPTPS